MPLAGIGDLLGKTDDPDAVATALDRHRHRLSERYQRHARMLAYLERLITGQEPVMPYTPITKNLDAQRVAMVRRRVTLETVTDGIEAGFEEIMASLAEGAAPAGPLCTVYPDDALDEGTTGDIDICVPVADGVTPGGDVTVGQIGGGTAVCTVHHGPYDEIGPAFHTLVGWISEHGHEVSGRPREVYLDDPWVVEPDDLRTEVQYPIR